MFYRPQKNSLIAPEIWLPIGRKKKIHSVSGRLSSKQNKTNKQERKNFSLKYCQSSFTKRFESDMNLMMGRRISWFLDTSKLGFPIQVNFH